ncbi:hypothetical protein OAS48_00745 [Gammaproteobacteria bacterium]|nr:hypothetical protein [Gammaproteobacteria bacterium]
MKLRNPFQSATNRLISKEVEYQLYEKAAIGIENNSIDKGVWTKAFSKAEGDELKQKAVYIELMVEHYKDEIRAGQELAKILVSEADKAKERQRQDELRRKAKLEEETKRTQEKVDRMKSNVKWVAEAPERRNKQLLLFSVVVAIILVALFGLISK